MADGSDIAGDGVNVAARLETLAEPGGVCVSGAVRDQIHGNLDVDFQDIGEQHVKNIARPIRAMAVELDPDGAYPLEGRAWLMTMVGRPAEAVRLAHEAIAMDPPGDWWVVRAECEALLLLGNYTEAVTACERATGRSGVDFDIAYFLAAAYAHTGNLTRAREGAAKILKSAPGFTIAALRAKQYSTHPEYVRLAEEHWYSGLRKAGLPEK